MATFDFIEPLTWAAHSGKSGGARAFAGVLLHCFNHDDYRLDITDLCVLDSTRRQWAQYILLARVGGYEPGNTPEEAALFQTIVARYGADCLSDRETIRHTTEQWRRVDEQAENLRILVNSLEEERDACRAERDAAEGERAGLARALDAETRRANRAEGQRDAIRQDYRRAVEEFARFADRAVAAGVIPVRRDDIERAVRVLKGLPEWAE